MKARQRHQLKFRVEPADASRVAAYCAARGMTESAVFRAALQEYLAGTGDKEVLFRRLDRMTHELARLGTGLELLGEMFGMFVQFWLAHNPELAERDKPGAQRDVVRRYGRFLGHVLQTLRQDRASTLLQRLIGPMVELGEVAELDRARAPRAGAQVGAEPEQTGAL